MLTASDRAKPTRRLPTWILWLCLADLVLTAAYLAGQLGPVDSWYLTHLLDLNEEANLPTWYSSSKLLLVGLVWAGVALACADRWWLQRGAWLLAGLFVLMSMDETAQFHEHLGFTIDDQVLPTGDRAETLFPHTGVWMFVIGPPALLGLGTAFYLVVRSVDRRLLAPFIAGVVLLVGAATGVEALVNFIDFDSPLFIAQVAAEELGEMAAVTLLLLGSVRVWRSVQAPAEAERPAPAPAVELVEQAT